MARSERLLGPAVLLHDLSLLLRGEIVLDVEELADLLDGLALDQGGDLGAGELEERLDIEVVGGHDDLEEHLLVDIDILGVPGFDNLGEVGAAEWLLYLRRGVLAHALHEDYHLLHDGLVDLGDGDIVIGATVLDQTVDQLGLGGDGHGDLDDLAILAHQSAAHLLFSKFLFN